MTRQTRLEILREAKETLTALRPGRGTLGLCWVIGHSLRAHKRSYFALEDYLNGYKPEDASEDGIYWFPLDEAGDRRRMQILDQMIRDTERATDDLLNS